MKMVRHRKEDHVLGRAIRLSLIDRHAETIALARTVRGMCRRLPACLVQRTDLSSDKFHESLERLQRQSGGVSDLWRTANGTPPGRAYMPLKGCRCLKLLVKEWVRRP